MHTLITLTSIFFFSKTLGAINAEDPTPDTFQSNIPATDIDFPSCGLHDVKKSQIIPDIKVEDMATTDQHLDDNIPPLLPKIINDDLPNLVLPSSLLQLKSLECLLILMKKQRLNLKTTRVVPFCHAISYIERSRIFEVLTVQYLMKTFSIQACYQQTYL